MESEASGQSVAKLDLLPVVEDKHGTFTLPYYKVGDYHMTTNI